MKADHDKVLRLLKTARGQVDGILRMVEEDRYCLDISQQLMAAQAMLNRANQEVLCAHLKHCVEHADSPSQREEKIDEFIGTLNKLMK